ALRMSAAWRSSSASVIGCCFKSSSTRGLACGVGAFFGVLDRSEALVLNRWSDWPLPQPKMTQSETLSSRPERTAENDMRQDSRRKDDDYRSEWRRGPIGSTRFLPWKPGFWLRKPGSQGRNRVDSQP